MHCSDHHIDHHMLCSPHNLMRWQMLVFSFTKKKIEQPPVNKPPATQEITPQEVTPRVTRSQTGSLPQPSTQYGGRGKAYLTEMNASENRINEETHEEGVEAIAMVTTLEAALKSRHKQAAIVATMKELQSHLRLKTWRYLKKASDSRNRCTKASSHLRQ